MARTDNLTNYLTDVADAIRTKTGSQATIQASQFDTEISNIKGISDGYYTSIISDNYSPGISSLLSDNNSKKLLFNMLIKEIPKMTIDFTNYGSLGYAFQNCLGLEKIDVSQWNVSTINVYKGMFYGCISLKEIDLSNWAELTGTTPSTSTDSIALMFKQCGSLTKADLSCFKGAWMIGELFSGCTSLQHIDIRKLDLPNCGSVNNFLGSGQTVPYNCEIIVGTQTDKDYMTTNFPDYTNVKTVSEYEANN